MEAAVKNRNPMKWERLAKRLASRPSDGSNRSSVRRDIARCLNLDTMYMPNVLLRSYRKIGGILSYVDSGPNNGMVFKPRPALANVPAGTDRFIRPKGLFFNGITHWSERIRKLSFLSHILYENGVLAKELIKPLNRLSLIGLTMKYSSFKRLVNHIMKLCGVAANKLAARPRLHYGNLGVKPSLTGREVEITGNCKIRVWTYIHT